MASPFPRITSPQPSNTSDSEDEEDFDVDRSAFYPDPTGSSTRPRPPAEPHSPAQWSHQLRQLNLSNKPIGISTASLLPAEILIHIFRQIPAIRDLHSALLVSRAWSQCSVELLWHKPHFGKLAALIKMIHIINRDDQIFQYATFIRRLNFSGQANELNDQLFTRLAPCIRLERLTLIKCNQLTDEGLEKVFASCPNLVALDLTEVTLVTDRAIVTLASTAQKLQGINLCHCKEVTDVGITALAFNCHQLRRIKLHGLTALTNDPVIALARSCSLLLEIDLNLCPLVSDAAVRDLWKYSRHLRELRLSHVHGLTDAAFPSPPQPTLPAGLFPPAQNNTSSNPLRANRLPPYFISRPFDHLRTLDLTACALLTDEALDGIVSNTPKIRQLNLAKCTLLTDEALISISKLGRHLHHLHLGHCAAITDRGVTRLARSCTRLRYIDLACCQLLTDLSVLELSVLPKLRRIGLVRVPNLTDQAVMALGERHVCLERIHLSYCEQITVPAIDFLLQKLPHLTHLSLTGIPAFLRQDIQSFCRSPPRELTSPQRAAFCVYSGKGVHDLKRFFEQARRHSEQSRQGSRTLPEDGLIDFGSQQYRYRSGNEHRFPQNGPFTEGLLQDEASFNALNLDHPWINESNALRHMVLSSVPPNQLSRLFDPQTNDPHAGSHSAPNLDGPGPSRLPSSSMVNGHHSASRPLRSSESPIPSTSSSSSTPNPGNTRRQGSAPPELSSQASTSTIRPTRGREPAHRSNSSGVPGGSSSNSNGRIHSGTYASTSMYESNSGSTTFDSSATSVEVFPPSFSVRPPYIERDDFDDDDDQPSHATPVNGRLASGGRSINGAQAGSSSSLGLPIVENSGERPRRLSGLRNPLQVASALLSRSRSRSPAPSR